MKLYFTDEGVGNFTGELIRSSFSFYYYHLPFHVICILLYVWMISTGKVRWLRPFWIFHVIMWISPILILISISMIWIDITLSKVIGISVAAVCLGIVFGLYGWILSNVLFLFAGDSDFIRVYGCGIKNKNTFYLCTPFVVAVITICSAFKIIVFETEHCKYQLFLFQIMPIVPTLITLIIWFLWWKIIKKRQNLSGLKVGYLINAILCVVIYILVITIKLISAIADKSSDSYHIGTLEITVFYIPFTWILAAFLSRQPIIERIFHKKVQKEAEEFHLSYISF